MNTQPNEETAQTGCPEWCSGRHIPGMTNDELALSHASRRMSLDGAQRNFEPDEPSYQSLSPNIRQRLLGHVGSVYSDY